MSFSLITRDDELADICHQFKNSQFICVDTEFHRETTYYPELALIQVADENTTVCIDPLSIEDMQPLIELFCDSQIIKVFHACYQDLEIFLNQFDILPRPVFDTQIAATLIGYGDQIGYAALVKAFLNIDLDKSQTRTDWLKRPLTQKQLEYAANDVYYLAQIYPQMLQQLNARQRLDWLTEDFDALSGEDSFRISIDDIWKKTKGHQRLRGQQLAILQAVASWRETTAQNRNKPRRRILPDDALIDIARQQPNNSKQLLALRSLGKSRISSVDADTILKAINRGADLPREQWPSLPKKQKLSAEQEILIDALTSVLKIYARKHDIDHLSLATRKQLEALVRGEKDLPILTGWRKSHAGQALLDFLDGNTSISVQSGQLMLSSTGN